MMLLEGQKMLQEGRKQLLGDLDYICFRRIIWLCGVEIRRLVGNGIGCCIRLLNKKTKHNCNGK